MSFIDGKPIEGTFELDKKSNKEFENMFTVPDDIKKAALGFARYMANIHSDKMVFQFESGIKFIMKLDYSECENLPRINVDDIIQQNHKKS